MGVEREVRVSDIGEVESAEIIEILVSVGDEVAPGDSLLTIESEKASIEIPCPFGGVVKEVCVAVGDAPGRIAALHGPSSAWQAAARPRSATLAHCGFLSLWRFLAVRHSARPRQRVAWWPRRATGNATRYRSAFIASVQRRAGAPVRRIGRLRSGAPRRCGGTAKVGGDPRVAHPLFAALPPCGGLRYATMVSLNGAQVNTQIYPNIPNVSQAMQAIAAEYSGNDSAIQWADTQACPEEWVPAHVSGASLRGRGKK